VVSCKPLFKLFYVYLLLEKLINEKHFTIKEKFSLVSRKVFSFYFGWNTLSRSCKKIQKYYVICWLYQIWSSMFWLLYIFLNIFFIFFSIWSLKIWFNLIFISNVVLNFFFIIIGFYLIHFLNWKFFIYQIRSLLSWNLFILFEIIYEIEIFFLIFFIY